jgi:hypothetical protein
MMHATALSHAHITLHKRNNSFDMKRQKFALLPPTSIRVLVPSGANKSECKVAARHAKRASFSITSTTTIQ